MRTTARRIAHLLPLILLAGIAACAVGRREAPQLADLPPRYTASGLEALPEHWWRAFADPRLDALIAEGLAGSPDLAAWWARLDQARALARQAGAGRWPELDLSGAAARSGRWGDETPESYEDSFTLGAGASYELDLWGRVDSAADAAALDAVAGREDLRAAALGLSAQIAGAWYRRAAARDRVRVLGEQVAANEQMLELVTLRFRRGQVGATDVLQQRRLVESGRGALSLAGADLQVLRHQLAVLLGRSPRDAVDDAGAALIDPPPLPATGVPSDLLQQRPDLRAARAELAAAGARVGAAVAERFPRLSLSASLSTGGAETANLFTEWLGNLAANLVAPLLDGGRRGAVVDQREAQLEQAFQAYRGAVLTALLEVEDALVQERRQGEYLRSLATQLELADTVLERTRDSYLSGQVDYLRVLEALTSQQSLQLELLAARSQLLLHRIDLCRALGGDWDPQRPATTAAAGGGREES